MATHIFGLGEALIDIFPSGEVIGGAPLNLSIRASELLRQLGKSSGLISRVGDDKRGKEILDLLRRRRVDSTFVTVDTDHPTGYVDVQVDSAEAEYRFGSNVAWDYLQASDAALKAVESCEVLCFGSLAARSTTSRDAIAALLEAADGAELLFDINLRKPLPEPDVVSEFLTACTTLKCNENELQWMSEQFEVPGDSSREIAQQLLERFDLNVVFWTRGSDGCAWLSESTFYDAYAPPADFDSLIPSQPEADSVGAGDAVSAVLAVGLAEGWSAERIVHSANLCGAFAARTRGATEEMPAALLARIYSGDLTEISSV